MIVQMYITISRLKAYQYDLHITTRVREEVKLTIINIKERDQHEPEKELRKL